VRQNRAVTDQPTAPAPAPVSAPTAPPRKRGRQTVGDMVRSLAVVLALVGVLVALNVIQEPEPVLRDVEYPAALENAQPGVDYELAGPRPLPAGWRVTSARTGADGAATTWHLGMVTADETYAAVEQTDGPRRDLVSAFAAGSRPAGTVTIGGVTWERLVGGDPEPRALVRSDDGVVTMVAGGASWADLQRLAAALG